MNELTVKQLWEIDFVYKKICRKAIVQGKAVNFDDEFYNLLSFQFGNSTVGQRIKNEETAGNCYFYALLLCRSMHKSTLKHGYLRRLDRQVENKKIEFSHAWVETEEFVYDVTSRQIFGKKYFYENFDAEVCRSYLHENLRNPYILFRLGINAVKERPMLAHELMEYDEFQKVDKDYVRECLRQILDRKSTEIISLNFYESRENIEDFLFKEKK